MTGLKLRLVAAAALFLGWLGWLAFAAADKSRGPVVSPAQVAAMRADKGPAVVAEVTAGPDGAPAATAAVVETLTAGGPPAGQPIEVANLPEVQGFTGAGQYLLLLTRGRGGDEFRVVGPQPSPGYDLAGNGKPMVYRWSADVRAQVVKRLP